MLTVREVAARAGVSEAAVRKQLLPGGKLHGERTGVGGRETWQVEESSADRYVLEHTGSSPSRPVTSPPPSGGREPDALAAPRFGSRDALRELEEENARLRAAVAALSAANAALSAVVAGR